MLLRIQLAPTLVLLKQSSAVFTASEIFNPVTILADFRNIWMQKKGPE